MRWLLLATCLLTAREAAAAVSSTAATRFRASNRAGMARSTVNSRVPTRHAVDANTLHLWRLDNSGADLGTVNVTMGLGGNAVFQATGGKFDGRAYLSNTNGDYLSQALNATTRTALETGEFTVEFWVMASDTNLNRTAPNSALFVVGYSNNANTDVIVVAADARKLKVQRWDSSAGTQVFASTANIPADVWNHIAVRQKSRGGGKYDIDAFLNGAKVASLLNVNTSGTGGNLDLQNRLYLGSHPVNGSTKLPVGYFDDVRVSNTARTDTQIGDDAVQ